MKCLQSIKTGEIIRVSDREADLKAGREWQFSPKKAWKATRPTISVKAIEEMQKKEETVSEKVLKRSKLKEKQRPNE